VTATLSDIAKKANVSIATVSRVLNEYPHVNEDTRNLVMKVAEELDYPIDKIRRPQNTNRTIILMGTGSSRYSEESGNLLTSDEEYSRLILAGTEKITASSDIVPRLQYVWRYPRDPYKEALSMAEDPGIDGVMLLGGSLNPAFIRGLKETGFPCVIVGAHFKDLEVDSVMADYMSGVDQIVTHLLESGRRRIGFVNGYPGTRTSEEKLKAFRLSLAIRDLEFDSQYYIPGDSVYSVKEGVDQTKKIIEDCPDIDAIIYHDDYRAMGGIRALQSKGIRIPDDVAVVGFHDYELAQYSNPLLTTIHVRMRVMGEVAAQRLCALIENPDQQPWYITVPTFLVLRDSA
jgi:DNA-binding LacI/PurR family transcriptional regulator